MKDQTSGPPYSITLSNLAGGSDTLGCQAIDRCGNASSTNLSISVGTAPSIRCSQVEICWDSSSNQLYNVQYRSDLTGNAWTDVFPTNVVAIGSRTCMWDEILPGMPQRHYRVIAPP